MLGITACSVCCVMLCAVYGGVCVCRKCGMCLLRVRSAYGVVCIACVEKCGCVCSVWVEVSVAVGGRQRCQCFVAQREKCDIFSKKNKWLGSDVE